MITQQPLMSVQIKLFGKSQIITHETRPFRGISPLMFAFISGSEGRCQKERLLDTFYPDSDNPRNNLRVALHRLKTQLPPNMFVSSETEVWVSPDSALLVDSKRFDHVLRETSKAWTAFDRGEYDPIAVEAALRLYDGEFLKGVNIRDNVLVENWLAMERRAYHEKYLLWSERLAQQCLMDGAWEVAERCIDHALHIEPLNENLCRMKVITLAEQKRYEEMFAQAKLYEKRLKDEINIIPSPTFRQTGIQIKRRQVDDLPSDLSNEPTTIYEGLEGGEVVFGRYDQVRRLATLLLHPRNRLLTLYGLGGVGKTVLAQEIGRSLKLLMKHGVLLISLQQSQQLDQPIEREMAEEQIMIAISSALNVDIETKEAIRQKLLAQLKKRELLLILDNTDSVMSGYGLLNELLYHAPLLKIITTSRVVPPTPVSDGQLLEHVFGLGEDAAVRQFIHCANNQIDESVLKKTDRNEIVQICNMLSGVPLAIKLAASWLPSLTCTQIIERLRSNLSFFDTPYRTTISTQMGGIIEETWSQLTPIEQEIVAKLSLFVHSFDVEEAIQITHCSYEMIHALFKKGVLLLQTAGSYQLHAILHTFAAGKLAEKKQWVAAAHKAYSDYYIQLMEQYGKEASNPTVITKIKTKTNDLKHALTLLLISPDYTDEEKQRSIFRNTSYFHQIGRGYEFNQLLHQLVEEEQSNYIVQCSLYLALSELAVTLHHSGRVIPHLEQAHNLLIAHESDMEAEQIDLLVTILCHLCFLYKRYGRVDQIKKYQQQIQQIEQTYPLSTKRLARVFSVYGLVYLFNGEMDKTEEYFNRSLKLMQEVGDKREESLVWGNLGQLYLHKEQFVDAETAILKGLAIAEDVQDAVKSSNLYNYQIDLRLNWGQIGAGMEWKRTDEPSQDEQQGADIEYKLRDVVISYELEELDVAWEQLEEVQKIIIRSEDDMTYGLLQCYALKAGLFDHIPEDIRISYLHKAFQLALELGNTPVSILPLCMAVLMDKTTIPHDLWERCIEVVSTSSCTPPYVRRWARQVAPYMKSKPLVRHDYNTEIKPLIQLCLEVTVLS